jgi:hypothetical protein
LGRELVDEAEGKCRQRLLNENRVHTYAENAHGAIFWDKSDKRGLSPLELVRRAANSFPGLFGAALASIGKLNRHALQAVIDPVPSDWMTPLARRFALELMCYNLEELRRIPV